MAMNRSYYLPINEMSQVGHARRFVVSLALRSGYSELLRSRSALVASELGSNLIKHARQGGLLVRSLASEGIPGLELLALDRGNGMLDIEESLRDGYSTAGSAGIGLGAVRRLSSAFDIYSLPGRSTAVLSRLWEEKWSAGYEHSPLCLGAVCMPIQGEEVSGDDWAMLSFPQRLLVMVADGLGHGPLAAEASAEAVRVFQSMAEDSPAAILSAVHEALRSTRGAAVGVAELVYARRLLLFAAVGNISGHILSPAGRQSLVAHNGTAGLVVHKLQEYTYSWPEKGVLILHSDGMSGRWILGDDPGLWWRNPSLIAGRLWQDYRREKDDVTVVVLKEGSIDAQDSRSRGNSL